MWYRTAQQQVDIGLQRSQSSLNQNTGIYATFAESQKMKKALQDGTYAEISTPAGKMLSIHGSVDADGQYGVMNFACSIVDEPQNLQLIQKAMVNQKFISLMKYADGKAHRYNRRVIATFRKDFWKEFLND